MMESAQKQVARRHRRWLAILSLVSGIALAAMGALFLGRIAVGQWLVNAFLDRLELSTTTTVTVDRLDSGSLRLAPVSHRDPEAGLEVEIKGVELRYDLSDLWRGRGASHLKIGPGEITLDWDQRSPTRKDPPAGAPVADSGARSALVIPPLRILEFMELALTARHEGGEVRAVAWSDGRRDGSDWSQRAALTVEDWDAALFVDGTIRGSDRMDWEATASGRLGEALLALDFALPDWRGGLPEKLEIVLDALYFQVESAGAGMAPENSLVLVDTGPGWLSLPEGELVWNGWAGASLFTGQDPLEGELQLHGRLKELSWSDFFSTGPLGVELKRSGAGEITGVVGPWSAQTRWGALEGVLELQTSWNGRDVPQQASIELVLPRLQPDTTLAHGEGSGEVSLQITRGGPGWQGDAQMSFEFPRLVRDGLVLEKVFSEGSLSLRLPEDEAEGSVAGSEIDDAPARLSVEGEFLFEAAGGRFEQIYLNQLRLVGLLEGHGSLPDKVSAEGEADWWDWHDLLFLESAFAGSGSLEAMLRSVESPGEFALQDLELAVSRVTSEETGLPTLTPTLKAISGNWGQIRLRHIAVNGRLEQFGGDWELHAETAGNHTVKLELKHERLDETTLGWEARVEPLDLEGSGVAALLGGPWVGSRPGGILKGFASGVLGRDGSWDGSGGIEMLDVRIDAPELELEVSGASAELALASLNPLTSEPGQSLEVEQLRKGKLVAANLRVQFQLESSEAVAVNRLQFEAFGGEIHLSPFRWDASNQALQTVVTLRNIDAGEVMALAEDFPGDLSGRLNGEIRLGWNGRELTFGRGSLELAEETAGLLRLNLDRSARDPEAAAFEFLNNLAQTQTAVESLRQVRVDKLRLDLFNADRPQNPNQLRLIGTSLSLRPSAPLDLTVNLQGDVEETLRHYIRFLLGMG